MDECEAVLDGHLSVWHGRAPVHVGQSFDEEQRITGMSAGRGLHSSTSQLNLSRF
jgi:hypothetical protein